jgi:hypothetical protein
LKTPVICFIVLLCAIIALPLKAMDFGLALDQSFSLSGTEEETDPVYSGTLLPWFSALPGEGWDVYASAGLTLKYENEETFYIPELFRTRLRYRSGRHLLQAGRIPYSDPLGLVSAGLFDGASYTLDLGAMSLSAAAFYSGFLYKKSANITPAVEDDIAYDEQFEYGRFTDTYFASRRLLAALDFEHPALADILRLRLSLAGQIDLNGREEKLHSQYFTAKLSAPVKAFVFTLGGSVELIESGDETKPALLGEPGIAWALPTAVHDRLSLGARFSSGEAEEGSLAAFRPLSAASQGHILKAKITGLSVLHGEYTVRLLRTLSLTAEGFY